MNPVFKEYVIDFADLSLISVVCKKCKAEIIIDMAGERPIFPDLCQSCGNLFDPGFVEAVRTLYNIYKHLINKDINALTRLRIRQEVNVSEL